MTENNTFTMQAAEPAELEQIEGGDFIVSSYAIGSDAGTFKVADADFHLTAGLANGYRTATIPS